MATPDLSEFHELAKPRHRTPPCKVVELLLGLDDEQTAQVTAALATRPTEISAGAIQGWFGRRDIDLSVTAIANHRNRKCACRHA